MNALSQKRFFNELLMCKATAQFLQVYKIHWRPLRNSFAIPAYEESFIELEYSHLTVKAQSKSAMFARLKHFLASFVKQLCDRGL